ncbi:MAG: glycoside hydrolase, partial [Anaerolineae bacterium]|nr:glycoside hydrolase [Anaerolineae bacterium]
MFGLSLFVLAAHVEGQSALPQWTNPQYVGDGWWQSVVADRAGTVHVAWYGVAPDGNDTLVYAEKPLNGEFTKPLDVIYIDSTGVTVRNAIDVTSTGTLIAAYRSNNEHFVAKAPASNADNARSWQVVRSLSTTGYYLNLIVDNKDIIHEVSAADVILSDTASVKYEEMRCTICIDLIYKQSRDGGQTWSEPINLTQTPLSTSIKPDIWQGKSGRIYVNWDEDTQATVGQKQTYDVRFAYSEDEGKTWSSQIILDGGNFNDRGPIQLAMTELFDGSLMAVWRYSGLSDESIYYQTSDDIGKTWTEPEPIPYLYARSSNDTPFDDYDLITDRTGVVYFFGTGVSAIST